MKKRSSQAGLALVEFAVVVPVLLFLVIGIIETGRFMYLSIMVGNAARAGVQYGAQGAATMNDSPGMTRAALNDGQSLSGLTISSAGAVCACWNGSAESSPPPSCSSTTCPTGYHRVTYVQVTASGSFSPLLRYPLLPSSYAITRQAIMRVSL
jgi:hypothetical protein